MEALFTLYHTYIYLRLQENNKDEFVMLWIWGGILTFDVSMIRFNSNEITVYEKAMNHFWRGRGIQHQNPTHFISKIYIQDD